MNEPASKSDWPNIVGGGCAGGLLGACLGCAGPFLWAFFRPNRYVNGADFMAFFQMLVSIPVGLVLGLCLGMTVAWKRSGPASEAHRNENELPIAKP